MNPTILSIFLLVLVVAGVECQQGEECRGVLNRKCKENEYCQKGFLPFLDTCLRYRERGMPCTRSDRCRPGLECVVDRDSFFGNGRCQDKSTTSTSTIATMPTSPSIADSTATDSTMTV